MDTFRQRFADWRASPRVSFVLERLHQYALLTRLDKPIGSLLLLWPTLWSLWIAAKGVPNLLVLAVFVIGVFVMRSAGCAINDYADRDFDGSVARTSNRPLAAGRIRPREAIGVFVVLALVAFGLVLLMNRLTVWLSLGGAVLAATYPFMKRYHYLPQVHLGAAFGWGIPMAYAAQTGHFPTQTIWLLFLTNIIWSTAYDTMYAMTDREDDLKIGVKSTAILFGRYDKLLVGILQALVLLSLYLVGQQAGLGLYYHLGLLVAAGFAVYEQWLVRNREPMACFRAFLNNNWFGFAVFVGMALDYALR